MAFENKIIIITYFESDSRKKKRKRGVPFLVDTMS